MIIKNTMLYKTNAGQVGLMKGVFFTYQCNTGWYFQKVPLI